MYFNILALRLACFVTLATIAVLGGCKSNSTEPSLEDAKKASADNLFQIAMAMHNHQDARGHLPGPGLPSGMEKPPNLFDIDPYSWRVQILPHIERSDLGNLLPRGSGLRDPNVPDSVRTAEVKQFRNPWGKGNPTQTHYRVFVGTGAAFNWGTGAGTIQFKDGLSNTILIVEAAEPVEWTSIDELEYDPNKPLPKLGIFPGGFHVAMADATVWWIPENTDEKTIRAMITRDGKEQFTMPGKLVKDHIYDHLKTK